MGADSATTALSSPMSASQHVRAVRDPNPEARRRSAAPWQDWLFEHTTMFFGIATSTMRLPTVRSPALPPPRFFRTGLGARIAWRATFGDTLSVHPICQFRCRVWRRHLFSACWPDLMLPATLHDVLGTTTNDTVQREQPSSDRGRLVASATMDCADCITAGRADVARVYLPASRRRDIVPPLGRENEEHRR